MAGGRDEPRDVRSGEELDLDVLGPYLDGVMDGLDGPFSVQQFPSGHSNLTYCVTAGDRQMVLRRPPFGAAIKSGHDMGREFRVLSGLIKVYDKVPRPLHFCEDEAVIGAPFYLMERVQGVILRGTRPKIEMPPERMRGCCEALVDNLVDIHAVDIEAAGLGDLGRPQGYVERQVSGWTRRYGKAKTDELREMETVAAWLAANQPAESGAALIHNDYKYDNVVLDAEDPTRIVGVLDWEMATVGDPLMDLGTSLGYWIEAGDVDRLGMLPFGPTMIEGNLSRLAVAERYAERSGANLDHMLFYYVYAVFKIAVIIQQIYARFVRGHTKDARFSMFGMGVRLLAETAARAIEVDRIDRVWE
jgi:aminoglycoside phosphotransferase (APT) family kinase protein